MSTSRIGVLRLSEAREFDHSFQVAAWTRKVRVAPGEYPVTANFGSPSGNYGREVYWVHVEMPGIIVHEHTPALFGGVPVGTRDGRDGSERVGLQATVCISCVYGYSVAGALHEGEPVFGGELVLDPEFEVIFKSVPLDGGRKYEAYEIVRKETDDAI